MKLGPSAVHFSPPITLVGINEVVPGVFHLFDVDVGSQPEHVGVVRRLDSHHVGREVQLARGGPRPGEGVLEVVGDGDAGGLDWALDSWETAQLERPPLGFHFREVLATNSRPEVVGVAQGVSYLFQLVQADFLRQVNSFEDLPGHLVGELALLPRSP